MLLSAVCIFAAGCASVPTIPPELDLSRAMIASGTAEPALVLDGPSGKDKGAVKGAAKGAGTGAGLGLLSCGFAGPLAPICFASVGLGFAVIGGVTGAAIGAARSEAAESVEVKRSLLKTALSAPGVRERMATYVQQKVRAKLAVELPIADAQALATRSGWTLRIAMTEFATVGSGPEVPWALQASGSLEVMRGDVPEPVFVKSYRALSAKKMSTADWGASDGQAVWAELENLSAVLATQMVSDLPQPAK
jgi:hypothetical protein